MKLGLGILKIAPSEFWNLTFSEFWPIYNAHFPEQDQPMTLNDYRHMKKTWKVRA
jgi:hypothetical protein